MEQTEEGSRGTEVRGADGWGEGTSIMSVPKKFNHNIPVHYSKQTSWKRQYHVALLFWIFTAIEWM